MDFKSMIKNNFLSISTAKKVGFFADNKDISLCSDANVVYWLNGVKFENYTLKEFVLNVLPKFKQWYQDGVNDTYVGEIYEYLILAENMGFKIDRSTHECLKVISEILKLPVTNINERNKIKIEEVLKRLEHFEELGLPLCRYLATIYNDLCILEDNNILITYDTFIFVLLARNKGHFQGNVLDLYKIKDEINKKYNYQTVDALELLKLYDLHLDYSSDNLLNLN